LQQLRYSEFKPDSYANSNAAVDSDADTYTHTDSRAGFIAPLRNRPGCGRRRLETTLCEGKVGPGNQGGGGIRQ